MFSILHFFPLEVSKLENKEKQRLKERLFFFLGLGVGASSNGWSTCSVFLYAFLYGGAWSGERHYTTYIVRAIKKNNLFDNLSLMHMEFVLHNKTNVYENKFSIVSFEPSNNFSIFLNMFFCLCLCLCFCFCFLFMFLYLLLSLKIKSPLRCPLQSGLQANNPNTRSYICHATKITRLVPSYF